MDTPLVSIVVATYCTPLHLFHDAIDSALAQRWPRLEILVCDDSPRPDLARVVAAKSDTRLVYHHNRPALGVCANHWAAFGRARGEFIAVLNHDDRLEPDFTPRLAGLLMAHPRAVVAFCDHWVIDASGQRLREASDVNTRQWSRDRLAAGLQSDAEQLVLQQSLPLAMGTLFRRNALPASPPFEAGPAYDLLLAYLLVRSGEVWYEPTRLSAWRSHDANLTSGAGSNWLDGSACCWEAMASDPAFARVQAQARHRAASARQACAMRAWADGTSQLARRQALRSLRWRVGWRATATWLVCWLPSSLAPARWRSSRRTNIPGVK
jgi:hypothetical protein